MIGSWFINQWVLFPCKPVFGGELYPWTYDHWFDPSMGWVSIIYLKFTISFIQLYFPSSKQAVWAPVPQSIKQAVEVENWDFRAGLHAACHALLNVVPM